MNTKTDRRLILRISLIAIHFLSLAGLVACERPLTIAITKDSNPPSFELSGSGSLVFFTVFEVFPDQTPSVDDPVMWKIEPTKDITISSVPEITYGVVPPGFTQITPTSGPPPPLLEGKLYQLGGPAHYADGGSIRITIKEGKTVKVLR